MFSALDLMMAAGRSSELQISAAKGRSEVDLFFSLLNQEHHDWTHALIDDLVLVVNNGTPYPSERLAGVYSSVLATDQVTPRKAVDRHSLQFQTHSQLHHLARAMVIERLMHPLYFQELKYRLDEVDKEDTPLLVRMWKRIFVRPEYESQLSVEWVHFETPEAASAMDMAPLLLLGAMEGNILFANIPEIAPESGKNATYREITQDKVTKLLSDHPPGGLEPFAHNMQRADSIPWQETKPLYDYVRNERLRMMADMQQHDPGLFVEVMEARLIFKQLVGELTQGLSAIIQQHPSLRSRLNKDRTQVEGEPRDCLTEGLVPAWLTPEILGGNPHEELVHPEFWSMKDIGEFLNLLINLSRNAEKHYAFTDGEQVGERSFADAVNQLQKCCTALQRYCHERQDEYFAAFDVAKSQSACDISLAYTTTHLQSHKDDSFFASYVNSALEAISAEPVRHHYSAVYDALEVLDKGFWDTGQESSGYSLEGQEKNLLVLARQDMMREQQGEEAVHAVDPWDVALWLLNQPERIAQFQHDAVSQR